MTETAEERVKSEKAYNVFLASMSATRIFQYPDAAAHPDDDDVEADDE